MALTFEKLIPFDLLEKSEKSLIRGSESRLIEYFQTSQDIKSTDQFINETPSFPGSTDKIIRSELMSAIGATLAIEGTTVTLEEIEESFRKADLNESLKRKEQEAENSRKVYSFIVDLVLRYRDKLIYTEELIKQMHKYFTDNMNYLSNVPGDYRGDFLVSFGEPRIPGLCSNRAEVEKAMSNFVEWLNKDRDGLLTGSIIPKAIMAHYYLTEIHPFGDGNGRTARALEALILFKNGVNHYCFWSLANFWSRNKDKYIAYLRNIRETSDPLDFILWGMKGYLEELKRIKGLVQKKVKQLMFMDYARYLYRERKYEKIKISQRILDVLRLLAKLAPVPLSDFLSSPEIKALYSNVSAATKSRDFRKLRDLKLVRITKEDKIDYIQANFQILEDLMYV